MAFRRRCSNEWVKVIFRLRLGQSRWAEKPVRMDNRRVAPSRVCSHRFYVFAQINTHNIKCIVQVSNCAHFIWTTKCCSIEIEKLNAEETFCKAKFPNEIALPKIEKNGWTGQEEQRTTEIFSRNQQNEAWKVVSFVPFATLKFNKIMTREEIEWVNFIC